MEKYRKVRSIGRGLDVLAAVNADPDASVARISERVKMHRTTVYRVLDTLEGLGYIYRIAAGDSYRVAHKVLNLSRGFDKEAILLEASSRPIKELSDEIDWPCSLATAEQTAMVIRETTHGRSALFVHDVHVGSRSPVLTSAMGRAYIAYCPTDERADILEGLAKSDRIEQRYARDSSYVSRVVRATREAGYGSSFGESLPKIGSIALPVRKDGHVLACVNVVFFTSAVRPEVATTRYLPPLRKAVGMIEQRLGTL